MNGNAVLSIFRSMELLLYIAGIYLLFTTFVLIRNWFELRGLAEMDSFTSDSPPLVSICIPARNEEAVIERCVTSALKQNYPHFEVLVLDDNSTDGTTEILDKLSGIINNLYHLKGKPKPDNWLGKPWACQQISEQAKGEYLVFIDADVWLEEDAISKAVNELQASDAITVWPRQYLVTFWEQMIIPLIYHALFTLLPAKYTERKPRWLPERFQAKMHVNLTAACGQFLAFSAEAYKQIGGHKAVKNEIVDDVALARNLKLNNCRLKMYHGFGTVNCRMYRSHHELFQGLRKNFFAGFRKNIPLFLGMALLHIIVFVLPFLAFLVVNSNLYPVLFGIMGLIFLQRWLLDYRFGWGPFISLLHPVSVLWYQVLAARCLTDYFTGKKAVWKSRQV